MIYLVDTNVLSEPTRQRPSTRVTGWLKANLADLAVDPVILGELRYGILVLPSGKRRRRLEQWFNGGSSSIVCLPWDRSTGLRWAQLLADLRKRGQAMLVKDSMIAATALLHGLTVVTRNEADFRKARVRVLNPFV